MAANVTANATSNKIPRAVVVTRRTEYERLLAHHGTREQARFFLETRDQSIDEVEQQHQLFLDAQSWITRAIPVKWRRNRVSREDLDRFIFEPDDIVIAVGQDGLVANTSKYLTGQLVLGFNANRERYDGILVPHAPRDAEQLIHRAARCEGNAERRTMVEAELDDGQRLVALNELYIGQRTHQSSRYRIGFCEDEERQSSSGIIVSTGTGATGWARSIHRQRRCDLCLPKPSAPELAFFVREAFPSISTGTTITEGTIDANDSLFVISEMNEDGVIFGDGIEDDRLDFHFGKNAKIGVAKNTLNLFLGERCPSTQ